MWDAASYTVESRNRTGFNAFSFPDAHKILGELHHQEMGQEHDGASTFTLVDGLARAPMTCQCRSMRREN